MHQRSNAPQLEALTRQLQQRVGADVDGVYGSDTATKALAALGAPSLTVLGRQINEAGLALVKHFEGLYLNAYLDPVGIWTIGYGHTGLKHRDGTVYRGRTISEAGAEALLRLDMGVFESRVTDLSRASLTENEFSSLVSFDFNTGGLEQSTLLRLLNQDRKAEAAEQFLRWNKAQVNGQMVALNGLTRRRSAERALFLSVEDMAAKWSVAGASRFLPALPEQEKTEARTKPISPD